MKKLYYVKMKLIEWNKKKIRKISANKQKIWVEIQEIDKKVEENGILEEEDAVKKKKISKEMDEVLRGEEIHLKQKAKCK